MNLGTKLPKVAKKYAKSQVYAELVAGPSASKPVENDQERGIFELP